MQLPQDPQFVLLELASAPSPLCPMQTCWICSTTARGVTMADMDSYGQTCTHPVLSGFYSHLVLPSGPPNPRCFVWLTFLLLMSPPCPRCGTHAPSIQEQGSVLSPLLCILCDSSQAHICNFSKGGFSNFLLLPSPHTCHPTCKHSH